MIVDLFAGPGGWSVGLNYLNREDVGIEWDAAACATRARAGHQTIRADVSQYPTEPFREVEGLIASPPCQDFSVAGKRAGIEGYRGRHVYEILRWAKALEPQWIACEQVPPVLPIWEDFARILSTEMGYYVWAGVLNAADYGVPQTRKRAILMASRQRFRAPVQTHTQRPTDDIFGSGLKKWVTMAEALGWGLTHRPAGTVASTTENGGPHGLDGGSKARQMYERAQDNGFWIDTRRGVSSEVLDPDAGPAPTITSRTPNNWVARDGDKPEEKKYRLHTNRDQRADGSRQIVDVDRPAPTITTEIWQLDWVPEDEPKYKLKTNRDQRADGSRQTRSVDEPAPTVTGAGSQMDWVPEKPMLKGGMWSNNNRLYDPTEEPAPTVAFGHDSAGWAWQRPSTTVTTRPGTQQAPGWRLDSEEHMQDAEGSIKVTIPEVAVLQTFPADYPWRGTKTKQYQQVGNAIPPLLAVAILKELL